MTWLSLRVYTTFLGSKKYMNEDKITKIEDTQDKIINILLEHTDKIQKIEESMATKTDLQDVKNSLGNTLDKLVRLAEKKDQEVTLLNHGLRQAEDAIEKHDRVLKQLAPSAMA